VTYRNYLFLFLLSLALIAGVSVFQASPGYMDAEYYYAGGVQLASGHGFQEPFLWNYLDSPAGLPHPSHTYWMPLASIIAAIVPGIVGLRGFELARLPFILIAGMVAPLTAALAYSQDCQKKNAILAGLLAVFPGYYLAYYATTDTFAIYMVFGTIFLLLGKKATPRAAALINGSAAHTAEFDDIFRDGIYHPGAPTIAAALALGFSKNISGMKFLRAVIVGYEISTRIGAAMGRAHYKYWHNTGTIGSFGAAAACSEILQLNKQQFAHAFHVRVGKDAGVGDQLCDLVRIGGNRCVDHGAPFTCAKQRYWSRF
jgi:hypothetical protein